MLRPRPPKDAKEPPLPGLFKLLQSDWQLAVAVGIVTMYCVVLHELGHAIVGVWCGDRTPKEQGRVTLNPIPSISPIGTLLVPAVSLYFLSYVIGWAKPVITVPDNFRHPKLGTMLVALAGPLVNFLMAAILLTAMIVSEEHFDLAPKSPAWNVLACSALLNVFLGLFNLLPIPPLDGHHVAKYLLPPAVRRFYVGIGFFGIVIAVGLMLWQGPFLLDQVHSVFMSLYDGLDRLLRS